MMNKLRKKSASNRSLDKAAREPPTSPQAQSPPALEFVLPESSFRSSLILPDLGKRFSLLAQANQPDLVKAKLAELRREGRGECLTEEEEDLVLRELKQLHEDRASTRLANGDTIQLASSSSSRDFALSPIETGSPSLSRSGSTGPNSASSPVHEVIKSPSSRSLFGGSNRDAENIRRARKTSSSKSISSLANGEVTSPTRRRYGATEQTNTPAASLAPDQPALGSPASIDSGPTSSPFFASTIDESVEPAEPDERSSSSLSPGPTSRSSRRKSLLDTLTPEQKKRVSSTLSEIERSFFNTPANNGISVNGLPSPGELSHVDSSLRSPLHSVAEPVDEEDEGDREGLDSDPEGVSHAHLPRSGSATSSLASAATGGPSKTKPRMHRGVRSGSISASGERITGYIPGMPRPITPQSRAGSTASSTPRFSTPTHIQTAPHTPATASSHLRSPSIQSPLARSSNGSTSPPPRLESYASSTLSFRQPSDDAESLGSQHNDPGSYEPVPSSFESGHTIVSAMNSSATRLSDDRSATQHSSSNGHGASRTTLSSSSSSQPATASRSAVDSSVSLVPSDGVAGSSIAHDISSRTSSSYGLSVASNLGLPLYQTDDQEEVLDSRRSSALIPEQTSASFASTPSPLSETHPAHAAPGPPPSASSMSMHGHSHGYDPRYSMFSGHQSSFRDSLDHDRHPSRPTSSVFTAPGPSALDERSQQLHPLHQSVYIDSSRSQEGPHASQESLSSSIGSSFHGEVRSGLASPADTDRGVSMLLDTGRKTPTWDQLEGTDPKSIRDGDADLQTLGGLSFGEVLAIQERLFKDRVDSAKGDQIGGVGLGGARLLAPPTLGRPVVVTPVEGESRSLESEEVQDVWSQNSGLSPPGSRQPPLSQTVSSFSTAGSEYSETFPQVHLPAPSVATSHRSHTSSGAGFHRLRPAEGVVSPTVDITTTTPPASPCAEHGTPTNGVPTTPSTPKTSQFSPATPKTPLSPAAIADPEFVSDYRAKIEAADTQIRELKKSPSMPKIGLRSRTKSIKRMGKISSPQLISTTAHVQTTDLADAQTQSLGAASGSSLSQRFRNMGLKSKDRPQSPPPMPSPTQPAFFSRPSMDQVVRQASEPQPAFVFPVKAPVIEAPPPSPKPSKPKRSFLGLLRSKKTSEVTPLASSSLRPPVNMLPASMLSPRSAPLPDSPVVEISHQNGAGRMNGDHLSPAESTAMTHGSEPVSAFNSSTSSGDRTARTMTYSHTPGSKDEGSVHAFVAAAEQLGIDPSEVNQLLQRSTSSAARKYSSIRSNSISNSIDLASPPLTREPSKRSVAELFPNGREQLQPLETEPASEEQKRPSPLNLSASVRSALDRSASRKSSKRVSGSVLRRTIIFANDQNRVSSYRDGAQSEFEVLTEGVAADGTGGGGMPSPLGSRFNLRHSTSSSKHPPRSPSDSSFFRGASGPVPTPGGPPVSPSETSFVRAGHSSTHASLYELYYDENDPEQTSPVRTTHMPASQSAASIPGQAVEILELANGDVVYSVLQGLRDNNMDDLDDDRWDDQSEDGGASTMDRPPSSIIDEPVQLTFRGGPHQQAQHLAPVVEPMRSVFNTHRPSRPARPETKVFYSSSKQVADLIAEISRSHDTGSLQFENTPSPTTTSHPPIHPHLQTQTSPSFAPLNLPPKRSISIRRPTSASASAKVDRGVSDAPSEAISIETNLDRLMGSLLHQQPEGLGSRGRESAGSSVAY